MITIQNKGRKNPDKAEPFGGVERKERVSREDSLVSFLRRCDVNSAGFVGTAQYRGRRQWVQERSGRLMPGGVARLILLCVICAVIEGCASTPAHVQLYEGEVLPANEVATLRSGVGVNVLECKGGKLRQGQVGDLLPGTHEITAEGWSWDRTKRFTNVIRGAAAIPCLVLQVPYFFPLGLACLPLYLPDKKCDCQASIDVSAGQVYEVSIDWSGQCPILRVNGSTGNVTVSTFECIIRE